jgi:hypothetical protein
MDGSVGAIAKVRSQAHNVVSRRKDRRILSPIESGREHAQEIREGLSARLVVPVASLRMFATPPLFHLTHLMNRALIDYYRCPESYTCLSLNGKLSDDIGFFRFGRDAICYGQSASGFRGSRADDILYDVLRDATTERSNVYLPFDPTEVIDNLRLEHYAKPYRHNALSRWEQSLRNAYYFLRPLMHVNVRRHVQRAHLNGWRTCFFPHWPVDISVENLCEQLLLLSMKAKGADRVPFVWFWPDGAESCVAITHDIETQKGQAFCTELMDIDDSFGVNASIQVVPEGCYKVTTDFVECLRSRGFEVNIQDLNHDGNLFRNREEFFRRARKINAYGKMYGAKGFRAAVLYRNLDWYNALDFAFDMSVPNVAHLDPQRGGCCTVMPYFIGDILEIPLTTTQDYMLFHLLNDYSLDLWKTQTDLIMQKHGLVSFIVHPDYVVEKKALGVYCDLLAHLRQLGEQKKLWFALAGEVNSWWRARSKMQVVMKNGEWQIEGPGSERAKLAFAKMVNGHLEYDVPS